MSLFDRYRELDTTKVKAILASDVPNNDKRVMLETMYREEILFPKASSHYPSFLEYVIKDEKKKDPVSQMPAYIKLRDFHQYWAEAIQCLYSMPDTLHYLNNEQADKLQKHKKLLVWSPRETGKTWIFTIGHILWALGNDPEMRVAVISKAAQQAKKPLFAIKQYITRDGDYKRVFPNIKPLMSESQPSKREKWDQHEILITRESASIAKDSSIRSYGTGGQGVLGSRYDLVNFDDVLVYDPKLGESEIQFAIEYYNNVSEYCLHKDGITIVNGTPWHPTDLLHFLEQQPEWVTLKFSFDEVDVHDKYFFISWPERHPQERLDGEKRRDLIAYNRNRRCKAVTPEETLFASHMQNVTPVDYNLEEVRSTWNKFMGMDLSTPKRKGTAICIGATNHEYNKGIVLDVEVGAWEPSEKIQKIRDYYETYRPVVVKVEDNAQQSDIIKLMVEAGLKDIPVEPITTGRDKRANIEALVLAVRNKFWRFNLPVCAKELALNNVIQCSCDWCRLVREIKGYPAYSDTDMLMSWLFVSEAMKEYKGMDMVASLMDLSEPIDNEDNDGLFRKKKRPLFDFPDYSIGNRISEGKGFKWKDGDLQIVNFIKRYLKYKEKIEDKVDFNQCALDKDRFVQLHKDMSYFCKIMNGYEG